MTIPDLRFAVRRLLRHRSASLAAVLTLALGIGAVTALFSAVRSVLLAPPPFGAPDELVTVEVALRDQPASRLEISYPDYRDWRQQSRSFRDLAAYQTALGRVVLEAGGEPMPTAGSMVSGHFFSLLGTRPARGRTLGPEDDRPGAELALVLSDGLWRRAFGGRPDVLGRTVRLDGLAHTVVGVMPPEFDFPRTAGFWRAVEPAVDSLTEKRDIGFLSVVGRLRAGVTAGQAAAELSQVADRVARQALPPDLHLTATVESLPDRIVGGARPVLLVLFGATALVLVIACVNVASLLLAQLPARRRELAVRTALGAGRGRLIRQLLAESLALGLLGGALGLAVALLAVRGLGALVPPELFRADAVRVDGGIVAFGLLVALAASAAFGLAPALASARGDVQQALRDGTKSSSGRGARRFLRALVVGETALAMVILVGAGLLLNGFLRLRAVDPGPDPDRTLTLQVFLADPAEAEARRSHALFTTLVERAAAIPGVEAAAGVLIRPLEGPQGFDYPFTIEGRDRQEQAGNPFLNYEAVTPDYFRATGLRLARGRGFTARDGPDAPRVVILGETVARRFWPGADPVGKRIKWDGPDSPAPWIEVVGVVEDGRYRGLERVSLDAYVPYEQSPWPLNHLVMRTRGEPAAIAARLRQEAAAAAPSARLLDVATVGAMMRNALVRPRFATTLLGSFAGVALAMAAIGLAGVLWFTTRERTREIGIRMALGASAGRIRLEVLREGLALAAVGLMLGLAGAAALARLLGSLLYGVGPHHLPTYGVVAAVLGSVALLACFLPAWRASREDAAAALRAD
ncbi:MAG TPA: ABC transporter permease [Gemmatimonadales bacterium]